MSWLRLDDDMLDHPKWVRAIRDGGSAALHLWIGLCSWCSRHLTDGEIPADMVETIAGPRGTKVTAKARRALADASLIVQRDDGGVTVVDYLERNPSRAEVTEKKRRRAQSQQDYADRRRGAGQQPVELTDPRPTADPPPIPIPPRSRPDPERDPERAPEPDAPKTEPGGVVRVYSMPSETPPQAYLDEATLSGVRTEQAWSTWKYYWGAGLPAQGIEKLHPWLCQRALERAIQQARVPKGELRKTDSDLDTNTTTSAATAFRPSTDHERFCAEQKLDLALAVKLYRASPEHERVGFAESERRFLARLKCWAVTGTFHPDGPLPKPKKPPGRAGDQEAA